MTEVFVRGVEIRVGLNFASRARIGLLWRERARRPQNVSNATTAVVAVQLSHGSQSCHTVILVRLSWFNGCRDIMFPGWNVCEAVIAVRLICCHVCSAVEAVRLYGYQVSMAVVLSWFYGCLAVMFVWLPWLYDCHICTAFMPVGHGCIGCHDCLAVMAVWLYGCHDFMAVMSLRLSWLSGCHGCTAVQGCVHCRWIPFHLVFLPCSV